MHDCDAIHPGYGFLSENGDFARACEQAGIKFIGPKSTILDMMGDKLSAKQMAIDCNVPTTPGTKEPLKDREEAQKLILQGYMHSVFAGMEEIPFDSVDTNWLIEKDLGVDWENAYRNREAINTAWTEKVTTK